MRYLGLGLTDPEGMGKRAFARAVLGLKNKGLAYAQFKEGGGLVDAALTPDGKEYLCDNARLSNPIDWKWVVTTTIATILAAATIATLFVACIR